MLVSPPKTVLKWFNRSSAVKESEWGDFALSLDLMDFQIFFGCFFAKSHIFFPSFIFCFCFALLFLRLYFVLAVTNRFLFVGFLFLKNSFQACLNSFLASEQSLSKHLFEVKLAFFCFELI